MEKTKIDLHSKSFKRLKKIENGQINPCVTKSNEKSIKDFIAAVHNKKSYFEEVDDLFGGKNDFVIGARDRYGIPINTILCMDTGLIRSSPYYTDQAIEIFYKHYYREIYANSFGVPPAPKADLTAKQITKGVYILSKATERLKEGSRILDFGCGIGATLLPFKEAGHSVLGLDYGEDYLDYGRNLGIEVEQGGIEHLEGREPFDLIILSHVLEHLKRPVQFLKSLTDHLTPNGVIYIEVPGIQWVHGTWNHDLLLHLQNAHVWYFTNHTLSILLSHAGLSTLSQHGSVAVFAEKSEITPLYPDSNHAARCLSYLRINEWIKTHGVGSNGYSCKLAKLILKNYNSV